MDRDQALYTKELIQNAIDELRDAAKHAKKDAKLKESIMEEIDRLMSLKKVITVPKAPKKPKVEPYRGGGTWHPPGMMPGGRMRPESRGGW